ncbi:MAG: alpha/beta hydrolase [Oscillospiraceae bacterium]|nr:alpha/beta hydrolase [Oscillospiraceae bacterium]
MKMINLPIPGHEDATLEGYILDCEISLGQFTNRPAIVICPGGGYLYCSPREAEPVALAYAAQGIHAFILRYSTGYAAANFSPLDEINWVIGYIRENAAEWHIEPEKIITCGFSAGGHLALAAGLMAENKPNAMVLGYPAVSVPNMPGADFMLKLLTGKQTVTDEDAAKFDLLSKIDKSAPPVFLAATAEDMLTGFGALPVAKRYSDLHLGYELHVFQHGPHGYSLADATSADGSSQMLNSAYAHWLELSVSWLNKVFGEPEFVDKSTSKIGKYLAELGINIDVGGHA